MKSVLEELKRNHRERPHAATEFWNEVGGGMKWKLANCLSTRITGPFNIRVRYCGKKGRRRSKGLETKVAQSAPSTASFHAFKEIALFKRFPFYTCLLMPRSIKCFS